MRSLKTVISVCLQDLRKWQTDYRIWTIVVLMIIMVQIYIDDMRRIVVGLGTDMPVWIFPFLYQQYHTKLIFTLPVVLLFCNAPFADQNQIFVYMRTGRKKWLCGQILYIVVTSALYYIFLFIVSFLSTALYGGSGLEWGKTLQTVATSNAAQYFGSPFIDVSYTVVTFFTPLQAVWFTFLVSWLSAVVIGLIIFLCNLLSGTRLLGVLISSVLVVLSMFVERGWQSIIKYSPISWNTLDNIDVGGLSANPSFTYCMCVYTGLIAALTVGILIFGSRKGLDIKED